MPAARHRVQDVEHHLPDDLQGGGFDAPGQIQDETQGSEAVLFEYGGDGAEGRRQDAFSVGRRSEARRSAELPSEGRLQVSCETFPLEHTNLPFPCRFSLQTRRGGLVKVHDSALNSNSQYKSLLISARTTVDELIALLLNCCNSKERVEQFSLYEVNPEKEQQRKLHPDDSPLQVQQTWPPAGRCHFLVRRNPDYLLVSRRSVLGFVRYNRTGQQLSKSQSSLVASPQIKKQPEEKRDRVRNGDTRRFVSSTQLSAVTKLTGSPSYADYENYFYI